MCIYREREMEGLFKELVCRIVRVGMFEICKAGCPARNSRRRGYGCPVSEGSLEPKFLPLWRISVLSFKAFIQFNEATRTFGRVIIFAPFMDLNVNHLWKILSQPLLAWCLTKQLDPVDSLAR